MSSANNTGKSSFRLSIRRPNCRVRAPHGAVEFRTFPTAWVSILNLTAELVLPRLIRVDIGCPGFGPPGFVFGHSTPVSLFLKFIFFATAPMDQWR